MQAHQVQSITKPVTKTWLPFLDGIRGVAALWVLASHCLILCGWSFPIIKSGATAVDIFMIMSGFLMTHQFYSRGDIKLLGSSEIWFKFYIRRFFRIAPLYYLLLLIAFSVSSYLGDFRQTVAIHYPGSATSMDRYQSVDFVSAFLHLTFLFGLSPNYAFSTPLPDWSIGLEMQFYLVFPIMMLVFRKFSYLISVGFFCLLNLWAKQVFTNFPMPTLIALKVNVFVVGILLALAYHDRLKKRNSLIAVTWSIVISFIVVGMSRELSDLMVPVVAALIALILLYDRVADPLYLSGLTKSAEKLLSNRISAFLADTSYAIYLVHLLILIPLAAFFCQFEVFVHLPGVIRFMILLSLTSIPGYSIAWLLFNYVEKPGISLGKKIIKKMEKS